MRVFSTADILIPAEADLRKWACIACDQFTSEPEYWAEAAREAGGAPSALNLIFPEAYIGVRDEAASRGRIYAAMEEYLSGGVFRTVEDSLVYVERTLPSGAVRRGLVGKLDLESYDWSPDSRSAVRATEGTIESRLPARVNVRRSAPLEMPHIMVFIDDPGGGIIPSAAGGGELYDFELMLGGGHIRGSRVCGKEAERVLSRLDALGGDFAYAMGDGNHSLAAAKRCWEEIRPSVPEDRREEHPARYALVELVNIHDSAVTFEPIHRALLGTAAGDFLEAARAAFPEAEEGEPCKPVTVLAGGEELTLKVPLTLGELVGVADCLMADYKAAFGGEPDYIHGEREARDLAESRGAAVILLPRLDKEELFPSVARFGPYPKKSFSIGEARDKRYYLECRRIR